MRTNKNRDQIPGVQLGKLVNSERALAGAVVGGGEGQRTLTQGAYLPTVHRG